MRKLAIALCLLLPACSMSNDEIIAETQKCYAAKMKAKAFTGGLFMHTIRIECQP